MKNHYSHCSTCRRLKDHLAATGREYSATIKAMFDARGSDRYTQAADVADAAHFRFLQAKADLKRHEDSGKHDNGIAEVAGV